MKITLQAPRQGIGQSAHVGFADVRNFDIDSVQGIARLNTIMVKKSGTTVDAQVKWFARDPDTSANIFALDSNGVLYKSADSGGSWTEISDRDGAGQGLIVRWGYVFVCEDTTIDVYSIAGNTWTDNWQTITSDSLWHPMLFSKLDGKIYGGAGRDIFTIEQLTTFDPANAATYTFTAQALTGQLPASTRVKCLEELGNNLMIGTWKGTNVYDIREATIYTWDGSSSTYGQPISIDAHGIHAMKNDGNSLIVLAGIEGLVYSCNGASAWVIGKLPMDLAGGKYLEFYPGALTQYKNKIFLGVGQGETTATAGMGVYSLQQTSKGNILNFEHTVSTLSDGTTNPLKPSALLPVTRDTLLVGWRDNATYGIDLSSATSYAYGTDYSGYFDSPLYEVGNVENVWKPKKIELHLGKPLRTDEGVKISYRKSLSDSWVAIKTMAYADNKVGAMISKIIIDDVEINVKPGEQIQLRVALKGTSTTTPEFKFLIME